MWKNKLNKIISIRQSLGSPVNDGVSQDEINLFLQEFRIKVSSIFPENYISFLKQINGIEFGGYILYGIDQGLCANRYPQKVDGLIDMNLNWRIDPMFECLIYLGHSSVAWYVYDIPTEKYLELDLPGGQTMEEFNSVDKLINKCLNDSLL